MTIDELCNLRNEVMRYGMSAKESELIFAAGEALTEYINVRFHIESQNNQKLKT